MSEETALLKIPKPRGGEQLNEGRSVLDEALDALDAKLFRKLTATSGELTTASVALVALTGGPELVVPATGNYEVELSLACEQLAESGNNPMEAAVAANGTPVGFTAEILGTRINAGGTMFARGIVALTAGEVLSVHVASFAGISTKFVNAAIKIQRAL
jgi:hypothetical protein